MRLQNQMVNPYDGYGETLWVVENDEACKRILKEGGAELVGFGPLALPARPWVDLSGK